MPVRSNPIDLSLIDLDWFWAQVNRGGECWLWTGAKAPYGYGVVSVKGHSIVAHRIAYVATGGTIPPDKELNHLCRNPACVNPAHLEAVPHYINLRRGQTVIARRERCKRQSEEARACRERWFFLREQGVTL